MKKIALITFALFLMNSCKKDEQNNHNTTEVSQADSKEIGLVQEPIILVNDKGEEITMIYFAEGDMVAVKIQKKGEEEQSLSAKTVNEKGNPVFTNEKYMWEGSSEGKNGKLTDINGKVEQYTEISTDK